MIGPRRLNRALAVLLVCAQAACVVADPDAAAQRIARPARLQRETLRMDAFVLTSFVRMEAPRDPIDIYIEGDGHAWQSRTEPAEDPTPRRAMALRLATQDAATNVVYLARPGQFTARAERCDVAYWTDKRYSREVVTAMNEAVSHYAAQAPGRALNLIGYSGGGTLVMLIAARRSDVASIRTVAGNLDVNEVLRLHAVSPMPLALNPIAEAQRVAMIPQIHFSGGADRIVPPSIGARYALAAGGHCLQTRVIAGLTHEGRWDRRWRVLLADPPRCTE